MVVDSGAQTMIVRDERAAKTAAVFTLGGVYRGEYKAVRIALDNKTTITTRAFCTPDWREAGDGVVPFHLFEPTLNTIDYPNKRLKRTDRLADLVAIPTHQAPNVTDIDIWVGGKKRTARIDTGSVQSLLSKRSPLFQELQSEWSALFDPRNRELLRLSQPLRVVLDTKHNIEFQEKFLVYDGVFDPRKPVDFLLGNDLLPTLGKLVFDRKKDRLYFPEPVKHKRQSSLS